MDEVNSEGHRLLLNAVSGQRGAAAKLARELAAYASVVSRWVAGTRKPLNKSRAQLRDIRGIPVDSWDEPPRTDDAA